MKKEKEIIMYDADGIVEHRTDISGWVGKNGNFYGKSEDMARYANSTHKTCDCGNIMSKGWTKCEGCRAKSALERFMALEGVEWDGEAMMCTHDDDRFFRDWDEAVSYCYDNEILPKDLKLVLCKKDIRISEINIDELNEEYCTEDESLSDFHPEIAKKVDELNELIRNTEPTLWFATNKRIIIPEDLANDKEIIASIEAGE